MIKISVVSLLAFLLFYFQFMWYPYFFAFTITGKDNLVVELLGHTLRLIFVIVLFLILRHFIVNDTSAIDLEKRSTENNDGGEINFTTVGYFILLILFIPQIVGFILILLGVNFPSDQTTIDSYFWLDVFTGVVYAPIIEEIIFRWLFFAIFNKLHFKNHDFFIKATINATLFSFAHWWSYIQDVITNANYILWIPTWAFFGLLASYLYYHTKRLELSITMHAIANLLIFSLNLSFATYSITQGMAFQIVYTLIAVLVILFIVLPNPSKSKKVIRNVVRFFMPQMFLLFIILVLGTLIIAGVITNAFPLVYFLSNIGASIAFFVFVPIYSVVCVRTINNQGSQDNQFLSQI